MAENCGLGQEEKYFPPDFKEYVERELKYSRVERELKYSGLDTFWNPGPGWVFWNRQDDLLALPYDHFVDSIPDVCASRKVRLNVRLALHKLMLDPEVEGLGCLVQFWAPTKTLEGRTLLTTHFQPFAIADTEDTSDIVKLRKYRMGMCREYNNFFYADGESREEHLGLPGRVFLNRLPESSPKVGHYTLKEYPQRDLALRCGIIGTWALPVFEHSSHIRVGVLEIASTYRWSGVSKDEEFLRRMDDIFQAKDDDFLFHETGATYKFQLEFGLQCFDGYKHCKMQYGDKNEALTAAFQELKMVYEYVCKIHNLPLALTWISCHSCNDLLQSQFQFTVLDYRDQHDCCSWTSTLFDFTEVGKVCLLKKGQVTGRILPYPNLLYCSDVKQFSIAEFPLVPYARYCRLGGWFTMCLQSSYTGDELYVLEFFLCSSYKNDENIMTRLSLILETMEEYFKTFKLASGQGLGEALSVEVIDFQNGQKSRSIQIIPATRYIPSLDLLKDGELMQLGQLEQPSKEALNNRIYVLSEAQKYNLPSLDSFQNGKVMTQLDPFDQPSMDPSSNGQNIVTIERNMLAVSSSKEGKRKMQDREHKKDGVRIEVSLEEILKCSNMKRNSAASELKVSISTLKRVCRDHGIHRWPPRIIEKVHPFLSSPVENQQQAPQLNSDLHSNEASGSVANIKTRFQEADMVTIRAKCEKNTIKFRLSLSSRLVELQQEVAKRLNLGDGTYYIKYKDEKDELILIACDEDLQDCIQYFRSLGNNDIYITLEQHLNSF